MLSRHTRLIRRFLLPSGIAASLAIATILASCSPSTHFDFRFEHGAGACVDNCPAMAPMMVGTREKVTVSALEGVLDMPAMRLRLDEGALLAITGTGRSCCTRRYMRCEHAESNDCFDEQCAPYKLEEACDSGQYGKGWIGVSALAPGVSHVHFISVIDGSEVDTLTLEAAEPARLTLTWDPECPADTNVVSAAERSECAFSVDAFDLSGRSLLADEGFVATVKDVAIAGFGSSQARVASAPAFGDYGVNELLTGAQGSTFVTVRAGDATAGLKVVVR